MFSGWIDTYTATGMTKLSLSEKISSSLLDDASEKLQRIRFRLESQAVAPLKVFMEQTRTETKVCEPSNQFTGSPRVCFLALDMLLKLHPNCQILLLCPRASCWLNL